MWGYHSGGGGGITCRSPKSVEKNIVRISIEPKNPKIAPDLAGNYLSGTCLRINSLSSNDGMKFYPPLFSEKPPAVAGTPQGK